MALTDTRQFGGLKNGIYVLMRIEFNCSGLLKIAVRLELFIRFKNGSLVFAEMGQND